MEPVSRRTFIKTAVKTAGAAAAVAGAAVAIPGGVGSASTMPREAASAWAPSDDETVVTEPVVAHVRDARSGEIALFVGEREITIHDHSVATRLARAAR